MPKIDFNKRLKINGDLLTEFLEKIQTRKQGFYTCIDDLKTIKKIKDFSKQVSGQYESIVILGIGGSALGPICLNQSLKHLFQNELKNSKFPKLYVLDNIDPTLIREIEDIIDLKTTLFLVITKSGETPETLAQYLYFEKKYLDLKINIKNHFVFITDPKKGYLRKIANEKNITAFEVPENVGGRFSVLTPVGLLPASLIGINIDKLLIGAKKMRDNFLSNDPSKNLSFKLAAVQYEETKQGKVEHVLIPYSQKLIRFADWYRQLLAESIGKAKNNQGKTVNIGITPINALGVTDQHSQSQLYNEGPNNKFFIFLKVKNLGKEIMISKDAINEIPYLKNITFNKLIETEMQATIDSLNANKRPNITIEIAEVNEESLGELFMLFEGTIAFLGEFFNINAFDQPGVELAKNLTKKYLTKKVNEYN